jgi:hypothetical protein
MAALSFRMRFGAGLESVALRPASPHRHGRAKSAKRAFALDVPAVHAPSWPGMTMGTGLPGSNHWRSAPSRIRATMVVFPLPHTQSKCGYRSRCPSIAGRAASGSRSLIANETQSSFASGALKSKARFSSVTTERKDIIGVHMKKIILATVLAGLCSTAALAADLGARTYTKAPAMVERLTIGRASTSAVILAQRAYPTTLLRTSRRTVPRSETIFSRIRSAAHHLSAAFTPDTIGSSRQTWLLAWRAIGSGCAPAIRSADKPTSRASLASMTISKVTLADLGPSAAG